MLSNDVVVCWGTTGSVTANSSGVAITAQYPYTFTTIAVPAVAFITAGGSWSNAVAYMINTSTTAKLNLRCLQVTGSATSVSAKFIAIGY